MNPLLLLGENLLILAVGFLFGIYFWDRVIENIKRDQEVEEEDQ